MDMSLICPICSSRSTANYINAHKMCAKCYSKCSIIIEGFEKEMQSLSKEVTETKNANDYLLSENKKLKDIQLMNEKIAIPAVIKATYGGIKDVTEIIKDMANKNNYLLKFKHKDEFNNLFSDPAPGITKYLVVQYKNIFGTECTKQIQEGHGQSIDLLR